MTIINNAKECRIMPNLQSRMRLLSLFTIFFVYMAISSLFSSDLPGFYIWLILTIVYILSLLVFYIVYKKNKQDH